MTRSRNEESAAAGGGALRALTYLAPGIPVEFFEAVCAALAEGLARDVSLEVESRTSGPMHGHFDPFAEARADIGFLCSPSYLYLRALNRPSIELVPAGFVFRDPRSGGRPIYYSELVVRSDHPARRFADLEGAIWGYNDECSLSGYFAPLQRLAEQRSGESFFGGRLRTGSHHASIAAVSAGTIDVAAIDSVALAALRREQPGLGSALRVIDSLGPFPIQPVVVRRGLAADLRERIASILRGLPGNAAPGSVGEGGIAARLSKLGLEGCVAIDDDAYADEYQALCALGHL